MKLTEKFVVNNMHYKNNKIISKVKTLVLHSIGTPQPDPDKIYSHWNDNDAKYIAQIIIGTDKAYEVLPCMDTPGKAVFCWHIGNANSYSIGAEMTEPKTIKYKPNSAQYEDLDPAATKAHVLATYKSAVDIFAQLCKFHGLDPMKDGVILSHSECYKRGIGTNHGDVEHLWKVAGLTMDQFRKDVNAALGNPNVEESKSPLEEGDIMEFIGTQQYKSAQAATGVSAKPGRVKITDTVNYGAHRFHVRSVNDQGEFISGVYGWVNESDLKDLSFDPYMVKVTADSLNIRTGPGTSYKVVGQINDKGCYTITEESNGWGKLLSKLGWIKLSYTKRI